MTQEPAAAPVEAFGPYALLTQLGEGGMARVYRAVREGPMGFRKEVAIKRIRRDLTQDDQSLVKHLINEARLGGQLQHPNVVDVYEFGQVGDEHYIAMEFVNGLTLEALIAGARRERLRLPRSVVLDLLRQVCDGLAYAHGAVTSEGEPLNLVHRDLKPANIIVSAAGQAKIMDFGIARTAEALYRTTATDAAKGTLQYMAPEQLEEPDSIDHRADIFALGSILFEILVGEPLLQNSTAQSLMWMVVAGTYRPRLGMLDEVFPEIRPVVARCVEVDRDDRFTDAGELGRELHRLHEEVARGPGCKELMGIVAARAEGDAERLAQLGEDILESDRRSGGDTGWSDFVVGLRESATESEDPFACGFHSPISAASLAGTLHDSGVSRKVTVAWQSEGDDSPPPTPALGPPVAAGSRRSGIAIALALVALAVLLGWWRPWSPAPTDPDPPPADAGEILGAAAPETLAQAEGVAAIGPVSRPTDGGEGSTTRPAEPVVEPPPLPEIDSTADIRGNPPEEDAGTRDASARQPRDPTPAGAVDAMAPTVKVRINSDPWSMVTMAGDRQARPQQSPYTVDLPAGSYRFDLRVPDTGQTKTLQLTLDGTEGQLSRCHHFGKDGPC